MSAPDREREQPLVLVVDDDTSVRILERAALEHAGFAIEEADNGITALGSFKRLRPDAVLLDVMMPVMDGFAVCAEIRKLAGSDFTPIFMVTGLDDLESINRAFEAGATDFIAKPVNWKTLGHHVRYMLRASRAFLRLRESESKNQALLNTIPDLMFRISREGIFLEFKGNITGRLSLSPGDYLGKRLVEILPQDVADKAMHYVEKALQTGDMQLFEYQFMMSDTIHYYECRLVVCGADEVLAIVRDTSERTRSEKEILRLAYYDSLTGLPNRVLFRDRLGQAMIRTQYSKKNLAIMFLDIDYFKRINDTLGHNIGDLLLQGVAERLSSCLRKTDSLSREVSDSEEATIARMGGDEFTILINDVCKPYDLSYVAQRICDFLSRPFEIGSHEIFITASIGITIYPIDGDNVDTLMKNADTAMYHAKDKGRNNYQFYTDSMNAAAIERFTMTNQIRKALHGNEFRLYYQPQLDTKSEKIIGVEALVRWIHPERGLVMPNSFIPIAEETSLIVPVGEWILQTACAQNRIWQALGFSPIRVAVNISSVQFRQKNFVETVSRILAETGLDPRLLELELTESLIMENAESSVIVLAELRDLGIRLSIDDFGTGYSSLSYLKRFPINTLKIDKTFIRDVDKDSDSGAIVKAIIAMAHNLNLELIAEGVETGQELAFLQEYNCYHIQGFWFCHPLSADGLTEFLQGERYLNGFTKSSDELVIRGEEAL
ncbi:MAG: EAL domain-containing protein [Thermodesulfovibrionales bacterium]